MSNASRILVSGGAFFAVSAVMLLVLLPTDAAPWIASDDEVHAVERPSENGIGERAENILGESSRRWAVSNLTREVPAAPLLPFRDGFAPTPDSSFTMHGIRYDDPTGSGVPLQWIGHDDGLRVQGFRLRDFATRDGSPLVRISPTLVEGLERLRQRVGELVIVSGYRHPTYNVSVGGVGDSQHQAGKAADIFAPGYSTTELALFTLEEMGCELGLGLGANTIHVDVRGDLTTWTYPGAPMAGSAFAAWVRTQCGLPVSSDLAARAEELWLTEAESVDEVVPADAVPVRRSDPLQRHQAAIFGAAQVAYPVQGPGVVVIDQRLTGPGPAPFYYRAGHPALSELDVDELVAFCIARQDAGYFAYAILTDDAAPLTGVMSLTAPPAVAPPSGNAAPQPLAEAEPVVQPASAFSEPWGIVVGSVRSEREAEAEANFRRSQLEARGLAVRVVPARDRYRIVVGPFDGRPAANSALGNLRGVLPSDAWLVEL